MSAPSRMTIAIIAAVLVLAGVAVPAAHAQKTIHVPGDYPTIQAAIDVSAHGDEILVAPGTYNETIRFWGKAIHLRSSHGPDVTIIDGTGFNLSVVRCTDGEGPDTVLEGFTITGGTGTSVAGQTRGGGMYNQGTSPTVVNCVFTGNTAFRGGGMQNINGASPTVTNCTFIDNSAEHGGGMHFFNCPNPVVTNCTFIGNSANGAGGGMFSNQASPTVTDCVFTDNTANNGGGMHIGGDSNPTVTGSTFTGNSANQFGGGMNSSNNSSPTVTNCTFVGNTAGSDGGGIRVNTEASPSIADSLLCENVPDNISGAWTDEGANEFRNSCVNEAPVAVAGVDQKIQAGTIVFLDGSESFDDDTASADLTYEWTMTEQPDGSVADLTLTDADTAFAYFLADMPGTYVLTLVVTDEDGLSSDPDDPRSTVTISSLNNRPVAVIGETSGAHVGDVVILDGGESFDPDGDPITFSWIMVAPTGSDAVLADADTDSPWFVPDVEGTYHVGLIVNDGFLNSIAAKANITVIAAVVSVEELVVDALNLVVDLPQSCVTTKGNQTALSNFLRQAVEAIQSDDVDEAINRLEHALERTDGCALRGSPDGNGKGRDWVTCCDAQLELYELLTDALDALTS